MISLTPHGASADRHIYIAIEIWRCTSKDLTSNWSMIFFVSRKFMLFLLFDILSDAACEEAYFKMNNVLIDDRRIKVDFSQSVHHLWKQFKKWVAS
jgi:hypothetical protein